MTRRRPHSAIFASLCLGISFTIIPNAASAADHGNLQKLPAASLNHTVVADSFRTATPLAPELLHAAKLPPHTISERERQLQDSPVWNEDVCESFALMRDDETDEPQDATPAEYCKKVFEPAATPQLPEVERAAVVRQFGEDYNVDQKVASQKLDNQERLGLVVAQLRIVAGGGRIDHVGLAQREEYDLIVKLTTGPRLPLIDDILNQNGVTYRLTYDSLYSLDDRIALSSEQQVESWKAEYPEIIYVGRNETQSAISVVARADDSRGKQIQAGIQARLPEGLPVIVTARIDADVAFADRGNRNLAINGCTAGFSIIGNSSGAKRLSTAAHCDNTAKWRFFNPDLGSQPMTFTFEVRDGYRDYQWYALQTPSVPRAQVYGSSVVSGNEISITDTALRNSMMDKYVCHRGNGSDGDDDDYAEGWSCSSVMSIDYTWGIGDRQDIWIMSDGPSSKCFLGDSGGAIYSGNVGYGILSGCGANKFTIFMAVRYVHTSDVRVLCVNAATDC